MLIINSLKKNEEMEKSKRRLTDTEGTIERNRPMNQQASLTHAEIDTVREKHTNRKVYKSTQLS